MTTIFSGEAPPVGKDLNLRCGNAALEYLVRFSDGSKVRVMVPPGGRLSITRGHLVTFDVEIVDISPSDGLRLLSDEGRSADG